MNFLNCLGYLLIVGIAIFLIGRLFPRRWISADRFIFRSFAFEKEGKIYDKIKISKWKTKLPDMSVLITKIIPRFMKKKRVETGNIEELKILLKETCKAETTHIIAAFLGIPCLFIWKWLGGTLVFLCWLICNLAFILIQRYNRPRIKKMISMLEYRERLITKK